MKSNILTDYYNPLMAQHSFYPVGCPDKFGPAGQFLRALRRDGPAVLGVAFSCRCKRSRKRGLVSRSVLRLNCNTAFSKCGLRFVIQ